MKRMLRLLLVVPMVAPLLAGCGTGTPSESGAAKLAQSKLERIVAPSIPTTDQEELVRGNTAFALDLYHYLKDEEGNFFYSPYSISQALAMTYAGARGETEAEMATTLQFTLPQDRLHPAINALDQELASRSELGTYATELGDEGFRLRIVNALWGQQDYTFLPGFLDTLAENYGAGMRLLDYAADPECARRTINHWVSDQTEERIEELIPRGVIDKLTRLVLTNAIYFHASWSYPFDPDETAPGIFHLLDGGQVTVPMMRQSESIGYAAGEGFQAIGLPYQEHALSMLLLIPEAGELASFEASLTPSRLDEILAIMENRPVHLTMPRFTIESSLGLVDTLRTLGMPAAFGAEADFSGMDGTRALFIGEVLHQAFVSVDEAGTEAAAATAVMVPMGISEREPVEVAVDRPFLFAIRDRKTGAILFFGRCTDPTS